ncbi:MAG TPA: DinB family protein [Thermoanaerobaculia bacterium]|jgi:hypothetical protein
MLEPLERELDDATSRAWKLVKSTDGRLFTVRPDPHSWSAAECLAHLSISTEMFLPVVKEAIEHGREKGLTTAREPKMDVLGRALRWFLEPPIRRKVKTAAPFVPKAVRAKAEAFGEFGALQTRLSELMQEAEGLDLRKIKIVSPFDKRVKYNLYSAFAIVIAHQRRHLWQAEQAVERLRRASSARVAASTS